MDSTAVAAPRFDPPKSLDNLPQEVIDNIWKQYFIGRKMVFDGTHPTRFESVLTINKKQSACAKDAMLRHAEAFIVSIPRLSRMLCHCQSLSSIRRVEFSSRTVQRDTAFPLVDDFFRRLVHLEHLSVTLEYNHTITMDIGADPEVRFKQEVLRKATWVHDIVANAVGFDKPRNYGRYHWLVDIAEGKSFSRFSKPPAVSLRIGVALRRQPGVRFPRRAQSKVLLLTYCSETKLLTGKISGDHVSIRQEIPSLTNFSERGGRGRLCDEQTVNRAAFDTIETIIERRLDSEERLSFASHESKRDFASGLFDLSREVYLFIENFWGFDMKRPEVRKLLHWLEERKTPTLVLASIQDAETLLSQIGGFSLPLDIEQKAILEHTWLAYQAKGPFERTIDLYTFIAPTLLVSAGDMYVQGIWQVCFDKLYGYHG